MPSVMVIEDEILLLKITSEFLKEDGFEVIETCTSTQAIAELDSGRSVDAILSDVSLPGPMDGLALVSWARQHYPSVPIILTSGNGDPVRKSAIDLVGDARFLPKPYHQEELARRLRSLLVGTLVNYRRAL
jgi:two-component system, response regulator PdtaR